MACGMVSGLPTLPLQQSSVSVFCSLYAQGCVWVKRET